MVQETKHGGTKIGFGVMSHPGKGNGGAALPKELDLKGQTQVCYKVPIALKNELSRNL